MEAPKFSKRSVSVHSVLTHTTDSEHVRGKSYRYLSLIADLMSNLRHKDLRIL